MAIKLKRILAALVLSLISVPAASLDGGCPHDRPKSVDLQGVQIEYESSVGDVQTRVSVQLNESYEGLPLQSVALRQGSWLFDEAGEEISAPDISVNLDIRMHNDRPFVQVFLSNTNQEAALVVQYGERCSVYMGTDLAIKEAVAKPPK